MSGSVVWLAEDDDDMRELLAATLSRAGFVVVQFNDGKELLRSAHATREQPDLLVVDHHMPCVHGLDAVERLADHWPDVPFIVVTAFGDQRTHARARSLGAATVLDKPFDLALFADVARSTVSQP